MTLDGTLCRASSDLFSETIDGRGRSLQIGGVARRGVRLRLLSLGSPVECTAELVGAIGNLLAAEVATKFPPDGAMYRGSTGDTACK